MTEESNLDNNIKLCECGCGSRTEIYRGKPRRFIGRHNLRVRNQLGENNHMWKGGQPKQDKDGYWLIYKADHPNRNAENRVFLHRLLYENYLSIILDEEVYLNKEEEIHHVNKDKEDNSLINLQYMPTRKDHKQEHLVDMDRICRTCGADESSLRSDSNKREKWYGNQIEGWQCTKCNKKEYYLKNKERILKSRHDPDNREKRLKRQRELYYEKKEGDVTKKS